MTTVEIRTYKFIPPPILSERDYNDIKNALNREPELNIEPSARFKDEFKVGYQFLKWGVIIIIVATILNFIFYGGKGDTIFIPFMAGPAILIFTALILHGRTLNSFSNFQDVKSLYYTKLKKDIIESNSYLEFIRLQTS